MSEGQAPVPLALAALQQGRPQEAADHLAPVVRAPELDDPELADVRARLCSLYAQALLESGQLDEAALWVRKALRAVSKSGDSAGKTQIRALQGQIVGAIADAEGARRRAEERNEVAQTPVDVLLRAANTPAEQSAILVKKASAIADERKDEAAALFLRAQTLADQSEDLREQVFARLGLAGVKPELAKVLVLESQALAEARQEYTLLSTIAQEASRLGVALPAIEGPSGLPRDA